MPWAVSRSGSENDAIPVITPSAMSSEFPSDVIASWPRFWLPPSPVFDVVSDGAAASDTSYTDTLPALPPRPITSQSGCTGVVAKTGLISETDVGVSAADPSSGTLVSAIGADPDPYQRRPPASAMVQLSTVAAIESTLVRVAVSITSIVSDPSHRATYRFEPSSNMPPALVSPVMVPASDPSALRTTITSSCRPVMNTWPWS